MQIYIHADGSPAPARCVAGAPFRRGCALLRRGPRNCRPGPRRRPTSPHAHTSPPLRSEDEGEVASRGGDSRSVSPRPVLVSHLLRLRGSRFPCRFAYVLIRSAPRGPATTASGRRGRSQIRRALLLDHEGLCLRR
jgi:hypothetical protein